MSITTYQNKVICACPECKKTLGAASAIGFIFLWCKECKKEVIFNVIIEPDCLRVTAFIENNKINEKTVNSAGNIRNF